MRRTLLLIFHFVLWGELGADDFKVEDVIHPVVLKLGKPKVIAALGEGHMAISSSSEIAASHVAQGLGRMNASWDFEAYRHFCEAVKADPDCLMAYWGIAMSLAGSQHEFFSERKVAVDRMLDLLESEIAAKKIRWSDLEKRYAQAAGYLLTSGVRSAGLAFNSLSEKYPGDIQARLFSLFLQRDGFDSGGKPLIGQKKANEGIKKILEQYPEHLSVMAFWVSSQAETPWNVLMLREEVLPVARKLVKLLPEYPPYHLMLAHVEARCGNAALAIQAANDAANFYQAYMDEEKVDLYDCDGWIRAKVYLAALYEMKGEKIEAEQVGKELAQIKVKEERLFSRGAGLLLWEGRNVGARIMMGRSDIASFKKGQKLLETLPEEQWFKDKSFALPYRNCIAIYLAVRMAIADKDIKSSKALFDQFLLRVDALGKTQKLASKTSSYSDWARAMNTLLMMVPELRGLIAQNEVGAIRLAAATWFRSASDRQGSPSNLLPPSVDYPMMWRLGLFHLQEGKLEKAEDAFREGLALRPNHLATLEGFHRVLKKMEKTQAAKLLEGRIEAVKR
ncbi:MAG: tetratricopeptide repeat protein [Akkermansiaceae bacterium]|nr:tetratricopeptide repeat protein [Akkermansiaceae bacterium]